MGSHLDIIHRATGDRRYFYGLVGLSVILAVFCLTAAPIKADGPRGNRAFILLVPGSDIREVTEDILASGGHVTHIFPSAALIAQLPMDKPRPSGTLAIYHQIIDQATLKTLTDEAHRAALIWNNLLAPEVPPARFQGLDNLEAELVGDALTAPPPQRILSLADDPAPSYYQTSEFLIGRVAVGIILPESDGSSDPSAEDWTSEEKDLVLSEIVSALDWWANREPNAHLTFIYQDGTAAPITTSYEPISRRYSDQALWISEVMTKKGYTGTSYFDQVRNYNNALRDIYRTDWAFTIFVVDSSNDADNRFSDGYFAYAYVGGPFMVMTYGNNGYGSYNMDAVAAHEIGHIFHALDQYASAFHPCTRSSGYLGVENQNSLFGMCASNVTSIMRGQTAPFHLGAVDHYGRGQLGWRDSDGDGILDPMDTTLKVVDADHMTSLVQPNVLTFTGTVQDTPYPSPLRRSTTINTIVQVQFRVADTGWLDAQPGDRAFDSHTESFFFSTPPLPSGDQIVELRVVDSAGNELIQAIDHLSVVDPVDSILDTTLTRLEQQNAKGETSLIRYEGQAISAFSYVKSVFFRIDEESWQLVTPEDGAFDESSEYFGLIIDPTTLSAGDHRVQAYSVDGEGRIETSPASDWISVKATTNYLFLPAVMVSH